MPSAQYGAVHHGRALGYLFCYKSVWNKRAACIARCGTIGDWAQPNKHFEFGFEKSDSKIASWYQLALLAAAEFLLFILCCLQIKHLCIKP